MVDRVNIVLLCEDSQQESFVIRFFKHAGCKKRYIQTNKSKKGQRGGAENVIKKYPDALKAQRKHPNSALIVMIDGDISGYAQRIAQLAEECEKCGIPSRNNNDRVAIMVPTRNIETWIAYLQDTANLVDEGRIYPKLRNAGDCNPQTKKLSEICALNQLPSTIPRSLHRACEEYKRTRQ